MQDVAQAELGSRKADLVTEDRLGTVKGNLGGIGLLALLFIFFVLRKEKKIISLFSFSLQH